MSRVCSLICSGIVFAIALACGLATAASPDLYRTTIVVSGQGEANRAIGLAQAFEDVLVKVSGDQRLMRDAKVLALKPQAAEFVATYRYRDRMSGVPIHDEQGSYDRTHDLTVDFEPAKIDALLRSLGRTAWREPRPRIVVFLNVIGRKDRFALASDGLRDPDMRNSLTASAGRVGLTMALPTMAELAELNLSAEPSAGISGLDRATQKAGGDVVLAGSLQWSDKALGWISDWRMAYRGKPYGWQIRGVGFDDAFRSGTRGAAQVLSGNGTPSN
ncbi:MAG: DUF2066 domain-containing protein [Phyllobacterium sp.]|uniref:DUF2066 domain-containing protein n=1 Tax=Phyllobacterium sp. TaxID=1871046 RepID=UPI0030EFF145